MNHPRLLVAGIGNIFQGDDAFGSEVVRQFARQTWPDPVRVCDFGIRGLDLAYALTDPYEAAILVDATQRGSAPGTLYLVELDPPPAPAVDDPVLLDAHDLQPEKLLRFAHAHGACPRLMLLGCEPSDLGGPDGKMGLSPLIAAAIPGAIEWLTSLVTEFCAGGRCDAARQRVFVSTLNTSGEAHAQPRSFPAQL